MSVHKPFFLLLKSLNMTFFRVFFGGGTCYSSIDNLLIFVFMLHPAPLLKMIISSEFSGIIFSAFQIEAPVI